MLVELLLQQIVQDKSFMSVSHKSHAVVEVSFATTTQLPQGKLSESKEAAMIQQLSQTIHLSLNT